MQPAEGSFGTTSRVPSLKESKGWVKLTPKLDGTIHVRHPFLEGPALFKEAHTER